MIISIGIVVHGYTSTNTTDEVDDNSELMDITEVSVFLGLEDDKIMKIIAIEQSMLEEYHIFTGVMFPYLIIDNKYYFHQEAVNKWIDHAMLEKYEYNTNNYWLLQ
ncbi:hypothetical protein KHQ82_07265 [Mycoplasmatota bacterium]|nr:hypothetical protein KHQ82_07265 [Mycoplasmatota bacterium]